MTERKNNKHEGQRRKSGTVGERKGRVEGERRGEGNRGESDEEVERKVGRKMV